MMTIDSLFKSIFFLLQMKINFMYENNCLLVIFCGWMESQKLKCYVFGPKSQKFPTAEYTHCTVLLSVMLWSISIPHVHTFDTFLLLSLSFSPIKVCRWHYYIVYTGFKQNLEHTSHCVKTNAQNLVHTFTGKSIVMYTNVYKCQL